MSEMREAKIKVSHSRLDSLQVFRGIAAISVLLYHLAGRYWSGGAGLKVPPVFDEEFCGGLFSRGHLGVDFFFVLSGFIIFWVHEKDLGKPERSAHYFLKRFFRIYPVVLAMVLVLLLINLAMGRIGERLQTTWESFLSTALLLPDSPHWVGGAWTLCHEVAFYAVFMVGILLGKKALSSIIAIGVLLIISVDLSGVYIGLKGATSCILSPFNLEFVIGMLVASYVRRRQSLPGGWWAFCLSMVFVAGLLWIGDKCLIQYPSTTAFARIAFGLAFGGLILWGTLIDLNLQMAWPKVMVMLGDASFSIYLVHVTVVSSLKQILSKSSHLMSHPQLMIWCNAILCLGACLIFWRVYERPILQRSNLVIKRWDANLAVN